MDSHNTTWISTVTGTGTTWTFSIVKEIFNHKKLNVLPKEVYKSEKGYFKVFKENALLDRNERNHYVLQCHAKLALHLIQARSKVITNVRNPYDNCASHYEFMKCDVEKAIRNGMHIPLLIQHYTKLSKEKMFLLKYEDIDEKPIDLIERISRFLGIEIAGETAKKLADKYSRENVKKIIAKNDKLVSDKILAGGKVSDREMVITPGSNTIGSFDTTTGYQSRHISGRKTGEWRTAFSDSQIKRIIEALDETAVMLGYRSEKV